MGVLQPHVVEVKQESDLYKRKKERKDSQPKINKIIADIAEKQGFEQKDFAYYGSGRFGFYRGSESYEKFKQHLTKNTDRNGLHTFKKNSKVFKEISKEMKEVEQLENLTSPFDLHDAFGLNNAKASQWLKDRFFVEVRDKDRVPKETCVLIDYKKYLTLVAEHME